MISEHFSLDEMVASQTAARLGIDNTPPADIIRNLEKLATFLEEARRGLGKPIIVTSGYRCPRLNAAIGGQPDSAHMLGLAADIIAPAVGPPLAVAKRLRDMKGLQWDQIIHEYAAWVHVGIGPKLRGQLFTYRHGQSPIIGLV